MKRVVMGVVLAALIAVGGLSRVAGESVNVTGRGT